MTVFANYIKTMTVLALIAGGLSACTSTRAYDLGAYGQVNKLQQAGCVNRIGGKD
ncbi:hypothetical protein [Dongia sp.]|uniref:hypothetical protein n=1 Tax=Dongia sp. TaxID=1977262 RepID=UPI0035ADF66C